MTGAAFLAGLLGHGDVIACDMGGTSFDVGLIHDGLALTATETVINQYTFFMPRLLIQSIGSGGGSIIWIDEGSRPCGSAPRAPAPCPGPPATAAAATGPRPATPTWCSGATTRTTSWAGG